MEHVESNPGRHIQQPPLDQPQNSSGQSRRQRKVLHLAADRNSRETNFSTPGHSERGIELHRRRSRLSAAETTAAPLDTPVMDMRKQFFFSSSVAERDFFRMR